jgi:hypothetical protein
LGNVLDRPFLPKNAADPGLRAANLASASNVGGDSTPVPVFVNIPFDLRFIDLYLAYLAGLSALGLYPRSSIEIAGGDRRLDRIFHLIQACPFSVHDLSRVELDTKRPETPRFNMPLELGLAIAWQKLNPAKHVWFIFEAKKGRIEKSMSDLNGTDPYIHRGRPNALFGELANAFVRQGSQTSVTQMQQVYIAPQDATPRVCRKAGTTFPFKAKVFDDLRVLARKLTDEQAA